MKGIGGHQSASAKTTTWLTPPWLLAYMGEFDLDPCCPPEMPWQTAISKYTEEEDGLNSPWYGRVWLNPPYTNQEIGTWMELMAEHNNGIALVFARTETRWFFEYVWNKASALLFLKGRLYFHDYTGRRAKANAGAPSVLIAYGKQNAYILKNCGVEGAYVELNN